MDFSKCLEDKFGAINTNNTQIKKPPVSSSLQNYLQQQSQRIQVLIDKKRQQKQRLSRISSNSLSYRQSLQSKIDQEQKKHKKNREEFLSKRSKHEHFRISQVERKGTELKQKRKNINKNNEEIFRKNKNDAINFWLKKQQTIKQDYLRKTFATPLYNSALQRKKSIENWNLSLGDKVKDHLLAKHNNIRQKKSYLVLEQKEAIDHHNEKIKLNLLKNEQIMKQRESIITKKICMDEQKTKSLQKKQKKQWQFKLKGRLIDQHDLFMKTKEKFNQVALERAKSMKNCRSLKRVSLVEASMTTSGFYPKTSKLINQQTKQKVNPQNPNSLKEAASKTSFSFSTLPQRKSFMQSSKILQGSVARNKQYLRQRKQMMDEKKIMEEKEISEAVKMRLEIRNESNALIRKAKVIG